MNLWPDMSNIVELSPYNVLARQADVFSTFWCVEHQKHPSPTRKRPLEAHAIAYNDAKTATLYITDTGFLPETDWVKVLEITNVYDYPCKVWFDGKPSRCRTRAELIGKLAWIFNHDKTINMIRELMK